MRARLAAVLISTATCVVPLTVAGATSASADNCEPTEPVMRVLFPRYEETLLTDQDNPLCYVLRGYVYPRVCDNPTTLLQTCLQSVNLDPDEAVVVQPYQPDAGRIFCSLSSFALITAGQPSSCTSTATGEPVLMEQMGAS
jgi:hypothetical protein